MVGKMTPMKMAVFAAAFLGLGMCGLLMLGVIGVNTGIAGLLVGLLLATLPVPLYVMLALWIDRNEKEPTWMLALAFVWGATGACLISIVLNSVNGMVAGMLFGAQVGAAMGTVLSAPLVEESAKALILALFFFWKKDEFDNLTDGIVYAVMVGLGFAMTENILYYGRALSSGGIGGSLFTFALRGMLGPFAHPLFTAMTGAGLGLARETNKKVLAFVAPFVGFGLALFLHFLWNASATFGGNMGYFAVYFLIMVPTFVAVIGLILFSLHRERKVIRANLVRYVDAGLLSTEDLDGLTRVGGRFRRLSAAMKSSGVGGWRREGRFQQAASELAFHNWRLSRGITRGAEQDAAGEEAFLGVIRDCRTDARLA